ncbi:MAG: hypothetical protein HY905_28105 [Deltaproteobacteria bacterium]|nr:hypothetical protein [Deltaproteobacteria bacterium]
MPFGTDTLLAVQDGNARTLSPSVANCSKPRGWPLVPRKWITVIGAFSGLGYHLLVDSRGRAGPEVPMPSEVDLPIIKVDPTSKPPTITVGLRPGGLRILPATPEQCVEAQRLIDAGKPAGAVVENGKRIVRVFDYSARNR